MPAMTPEAFAALDIDFKKHVLSEDLFLLMKPFGSLIPRMDDDVFHSVCYIASADKALHATPSHAPFFTWPTSPSDCDWIVPGTQMSRGDHVRLQACGYWPY